VIDARCNGQPVQGFALDSRAAHYGDGAFTTIRVHAGTACWWTLHEARLRAACTALHLIEPDFAALDTQVDAMAAKAGDAVVKVLLVPQSQGRGYARPWPTAIDVFVLAYAAATPTSGDYVQGVALAQSDVVLADAEPFGIKSLSRMNQVLAQSHAQGAAAMVCDRDGFIGHASSCNLFAQFGALLVTPPAGHGVIAGVARAALLQSPPPGFSVRVQSMHRDALQHADAVILSNAVRGFVPVSHFGARAYARRDAVVALQRRFHAPLGLPEG